MFRYLIESNPKRERPVWSLLVSAVTNGAIVVAGISASDRQPGDPLVTEAQTRVQYFLPPLPAPERVQVTGVKWAVGLAPGAGDLPVTGKGLAVAGSREIGPDEGRHGETEEPVVADSSGPAYGTGDPVYVESELDKPVERDAASVGPAYPKLLQEKGIEGSVGVEFVVDTTGRADPASFKVLESTHPLFVESVREALPFMLFRPAELGTGRVRQLVSQKFRFEMQMPTKETAAGGRKP